MALTFPSSPTNGQIYTDTATGYRYTYNATAGVWAFSSNNVGMSVSSTPPGNVGSGSMWYNREIGRTFVYYNDGDSSHWVETVPAGAVDTNTIAAYTNPIFASMNGAYTTANNALANTTGRFAGTLTTTGGVIAANVGAGFAPPTGYYFAAGADIARGISVDSNRLTHIRYDNNGLNPFYVKNIGITAVNHGTGINFRIGADGVNEYQSGSVYSVANGLFTSSVTANSHLTFGTVLQDNLNERMRITDAGRVGIGTADPVSRLHISASSAIDTTGARDRWMVRLRDTTSMAAGVGASILFQGSKTAGGGAGNFAAIAGLKENSTEADESGYLALYTVPNSTQFITERMRISSSGYVTVSNQPKFWINGADSMTAGTTPAKMNFSGTNYDTANGWSDANDRYTAPVSGYYYIYTKINIQASATTTYVMIYKNGSQYSNGWMTNNFRLDYWVNHIVQLSAGDYVEIWISTAAGTTGIDNSGYFGGYLLG